MFRSLEFIFAFCMLVLFLPIMLVVSLIILLTMGRPILFRQQRPGLNGQPFIIYKFRTMQPGNGSDTARLTPVGAWLRKLSLDELPQLYNVLIGNLSLVGPRPLLMEYLPLYSPQQARRHLVKPGITGWAQIHGRNAISWEDRFKLDIWYVDHKSFYLDLKILVLTVLTVIRAQDIGYQDQPTAQKFTGTHTGA